MSASPTFQIPGEMLHAMKTRPESEWKGLFRGLIQQKAMQITGADTEEKRLSIYAGVKELQTLEQFFLSEMKRK